MGASLVTGVNGFIASHLFEALQAVQDRVVGLASDHAVIFETGETRIIHFEKYSPFDVVSSLIDELNIDTVFHLATRFAVDNSHDDVQNMVRDNIGLLAGLADCLNDRPAFVINARSYWQYAAASRNRKAGNLYAATKNAADEILAYYAAETPIQIAGVVLGDTYGPSDPRGKFVSHMAQSAKANTCLQLFNPQHPVSLLHVSDVVSGFLALYKHLKDTQESHIDYRLISPEIITLDDLVKRAAHIFETPINVHYPDGAGRKMKNLPPWHLGRKIPGWAAQVTLDDGLKQVWDALT